MCACALMCARVFVCVLMCVGVCVCMCVCVRESVDRQTHVRRAGIRPSVPASAQTGRGRGVLK